MVVRGDEWPSRMETRSTGTPLDNRAVAIVWRNLCAWPLTAADLNSLRNATSKFPRRVATFPFPLQKKYFEVLGIAPSAATTSGGSGRWTSVPVLAVYRNSLSPVNLDRSSVTASVMRSPLHRNSSTNALMGSGLDFSVL